MGKKFLAFLMAITLVVLSFAGCSKSKAEDVKPVEDFRVVAYVRGDYVQDEGTVHGEDFDIITHVILFECASFNADGQVVLETEKLETALKNIRTAIGERDVKISLNLLGPGNTSDSDVWEEQMESQSEHHNSAFKSGVLEENIINVLDKYGFDGVHFDYEYPLSDNAWKYYNNFLVSLDKKLGDYTLGVAGNYWNIHFTREALNAIDTFELMIYDMVDGEGRHATYEDTVAAVQRLGFQGMIFEKVNIGLPFYSRPTDMSAYWYGYNGCYEKIDENGWYHCDNTNKDFWFNTPDVIEAKTEYALNNGFGGVMIWHYNCDLPSTHEDSLLRAVGSAIKNCE